MTAVEVVMKVYRRYTQNDTEEKQEEPDLVDQITIFWMPKNVCAFWRREPSGQVTRPEDEDDPAQLPAAAVNGAVKEYPLAPTDASTIYRQHNQLRGRF